jgi:hypothetical protein
MKAKSIITTAAIIMTANALLIGYIHGYRLADFSEVPNSQRPSGIYAQATIDTILADIYGER